MERVSASKVRAVAVPVPRFVVSSLSSVSIVPKRRPGAELVMVPIETKVSPRAAFASASANSAEIDADQIEVAFTREYSAKRD